MSDNNSKTEEATIVEIRENKVSLGSKIAVVVYCEDKNGTFPSAFTCGTCRELWCSLKSLALPADHLIIIHDNKWTEHIRDDIDPVLNASDPSGLFAMRKRTTVCHTGGGAGRSRAYQIGIALALRTQAEIIAFLDGNAFPHPLWTYEIVRFFMRHRGICITTGETIPTNQETCVQEYEPDSDKDDGADAETNDIDLRNFAIVRPVAESDTFDGCNHEYSTWILVHGAVQGFRTGHNPNMIVNSDREPIQTGQDRDDCDDFC
ncbi:MAG: hypothetical protein IJR99_11600 [Kiritimatiellae bacterium]|nr:hypothetical protein [Kiritimatiellia bacterium]